MKKGKASSKPTVELIVRRGALRRFDKLKMAVAHLPVTISWDRRVAERRDSEADVEGERRRTERRGTPPYIWETADFVVVEKVEKPAETPVEAPAEKPAARSRKKRR